MDIEEFERYLEELDANLPERPPDGEPIVMTEREAELWNEHGQFSRHYKDGTIVFYMTNERRDELRSMFGMSFEDE